MVDIDMDRLAVLASLHCTYEELAAAFGCSLRTIERRVAEDVAFREVIERARADGRRSLRRQLWGLALKAGTPQAPAASLPALLFLCKQPERQGGLGMSDRLPGQPEGAQTPEGAFEDAEAVRREVQDKLDRLAARQKRAPARKKA